MRAIFWLVLLLLIGFAVRKKIRNRAQSLEREARRTEANPMRDMNAATPEAMVCCAKCQTYVPISEAIVREQQYYCCAAHATPT
ncbi:MAG: hypothetical protein K2Y28_04340 [Burkholderiaceae bacterium]|nr:hypothetical protein [Burkholderiaceae bacterium]